MKDINIFDYEVPEGKGVMGVLNEKGDTKIFWDKNNKDEVENAKRMFNEMVKEKKFVAFSIKDGEKHKKIKRFSPKTQKLILIPPMGGGQHYSGAGGTAGESPIEACDPPQYHPGRSGITEEAEIKAAILLKDKIGEEKFLRLVALDYVEVKGKFGEYRIYKDGRLELLRYDTIGKKKRPIIWGLCVEVKMDIPKADRILSIYLSIKENENHLIRTANFRFINTIDEYNRRRS